MEMLNMSQSNKRRQKRYDPARDPSTIGHKKYEGTFGVACLSKEGDDVTEMYQPGASTTMLFSRVELMTVLNWATKAPVGVQYIALEALVTPEGKPDLHIHLFLSDPTGKSTTN